MTHIIVLDSVIEDIFVCGHCKTVFNSLSLFLEHKNSYCITSNEKFELENIGNVSVMKNDHEVPKEITPPIEDFNTAQYVDNLTASDVGGNCKSKCNICKKKFKKYETLLTHKKNHELKLYQCLICGRCFMQNSHLQRHIISHKVWPDGLTETTAKSLEVELLSYSCPYCHLILPNYSKFRVHLKNHSSYKKFKCIQGECMSFFDEMKMLVDHVCNTHRHCLYSCHKCNMTFDSLDSIATHHQNHSESNNKECSPIKYKCSKCDATFNKAERLSLHVLTESHRKTCIHCNKTFASDKRLRLHLQVHRKLKTFQCNICSSAFHMKKYLTAHMSRHSEHRFICNICNNKYKRKDLLQRHLKSHQAKKPLTCPFSDSLNCKMEFFRTDKLKSHVKSHTKHLTMTPSTTKRPNARTVEICIVPLNMNS